MPSFKCRTQVDDMVSAFNDKVIRKVNKLGNSKSDGISIKGHHVYNNNPFGVTSHLGSWFYLLEEWEASPFSTAVFIMIM